MDLFDSGRWPSIYDKEDLSKAIRDVAGVTPLSARFYELTLSFSRGGPICQGDVVELRSAVPIIDRDGTAIVTDIEYDHWLVVGNTCDTSRSDVLYTLLAPIKVVERDVSEDDVRMFRRYEYYRQFYLPPWPNSPDGRHGLADFMQMVTIEKAAVRDDCARVVARMQFHAWALLHACLVRFLARDDGRFD